MSPAAGFPSRSIAALNDDFASVRSLLASSPGGVFSKCANWEEPSRYRAWLEQGVISINCWHVWNNGEICWYIICFSWRLLTQLGYRVPRNMCVKTCVSRVNRSTDWQAARTGRWWFRDPQMSDCNKNMVTDIKDYPIICKKVILIQTWPEIIN